MKSEKDWRIRKSQTFAGFPTWEEATAKDADFVVIGVPFVTDYPSDSPTVAPPMGEAAGPGGAPDAIREASHHFINYLGNYDFEVDAAPSLGGALKVFDYGDVRMDFGDPDGSQTRAADAIRLVVSAGAIPIVLGGDHATTIPALRAFEGHGPLCVVQIDAHLDWRDEVSGVRNGLSSPMRRGSEMPWVRSMVQFGLRGYGSARKREVEAARAFGSVLVKAEEVHEVGARAVLEKVPRGEAYYLTIDIDGLDPAVAPGVNYPSHGGLSYPQVARIIRGLTERGSVVGMDIVEIAPGMDTAGRTCLLAARLILTLMGHRSVAKGLS